MLRLGLCCTFRDEPIRFFNTTVAASCRMVRSDALAKLSELCLANAQSLLAALHYCANHGIGSFRVNSQILPLKTHSACGYTLDVLPRGDEIERAYRQCGDLVRERGLRTCFHPDQFVVLNSLRPEVVTASIQEIEYQAEVAEWIGADVVNVHGGGVYGNKTAAIDAFARAVDRLSDRARERLTVENDDKLFTVADLMPLCRQTGIPLVYDVHHHRCHPDGLTIEEATQLAVTTWNREPMFHISSPLEGWKGPRPERHHDFINIRDFPRVWRSITATVEVEAKAKEVAVLKLQKQLSRFAPRK